MPKKKDFDEVLKIFNDAGIEVEMVTLEDFVRIMVEATSEEEPTVH